MIPDAKHYPMRSIAVIAHAIFIMLLSAIAGCEPPQAPPPTLTNDANSPIPACVRYAPVKIDILPLTEFTALETAEPHITTYVSLVDAYGSQIKSPGKFRFELYERVPRSAAPKGRRLQKWPDPPDPAPEESHWIDLCEPAQNNSHWRDFIRAYNFNLPFKPAPNQDYILEVTCQTTNGKRLTAQLPIRHAE